MKSNSLGVIFIVGATLVPGCAEPDGRLAELAARSTAEQAQQNQALIKASSRLIDANQQLVERDTEARKELVELQQNLRQDQAEVGHQRDLLDAERRTLTLDRQRESIWSSLILSVAVILSSLAPLLLSGMALWIAWQSPADQACAEVLLEEMATHSSACSESRPTLPPMANQSVSRLPGPTGAANSKNSPSDSAS